MPSIIVKNNLLVTRDTAPMRVVGLLRLRYDIDGAYKEYPIVAILDSGSETNLMSYKLAISVSLPIRPITSSFTVYYRLIIKYYDEIMIKLIIKGYWTYIYYFVMFESLVAEDLLLDILFYWNAKLCYEYNNNINVLRVNVIFNKI